MKILFLSISILLLIAFSVNAQTISGCGTLVQGSECVLIQMDGINQLVAADNTCQYVVGDRVCFEAHFIFPIVPVCGGEGVPVVIDYIEGCTVSYENCGVLGQGVEGCVTISTDDGHVYMVFGDVGNYQSGDYVKVSGGLDLSCTTTCMAGEGCLYLDSIQSCSPYDATVCGTLVQGNNCVLLQTDDNSLVYLDYFCGEVGDYVCASGSYSILTVTPCEGEEDMVMNVEYMDCFDMVDYCGRVEVGFECTMFIPVDSSSFFPYVLDNYFGHEDGDIFRAKGYIVPTDYWVCMGFQWIIHVTSISECGCVGMRGNCDGDMADEITISDLTFLVEYLFLNGEAPINMDEADIDGSGEILITDITYLVNYMFLNGDSPASCP